MNTKQDGQKRMTIKTFVFRVLVVLVLEAILLYFGNVSLLVHLIVTGITMFTTSILACVVFLSEEEMNRMFSGKTANGGKKKKRHSSSCMVC